MIQKKAKDGVIQTGNYYKRLMLYETLMINFLLDLFYKF